MSRSGLSGSSGAGHLRRVGGYLVGMGLIAASSTVVAAARPQPLRYPLPANSFDLTVGARREKVMLGIQSATEGPHRVTVTAGAEQASFVHREMVATYQIDIGSRAGSAGRVGVSFDPPAAVVIDPSPSGARSVRPKLSWGPLPPSLQLPAPSSAGLTGDAEASVDETDVFGLRLFGVPVRTAPRVSAAAVTSVSHGDRLTASCWAIGDHVSNGFAEYPAGDAYQSDVWFLVDTPAGRGFVPDVRYARRGTAGRLGLPPCP